MSQSNEYINKIKALEEVLNNYNNENDHDLTYDPSIIIKKYNNLNAAKDSEIKVFEFLDKFCKNTEGLVNENQEYEDIIEELDEMMIIDKEDEKRTQKPIFKKKVELMSIDIQDEKVIIGSIEYSEETNINSMNVENKNKFKKVKKNEKKLTINNQ